MAIINKLPLPDAFGDEAEEVRILSELGTNRTSTGDLIFTSSTSATEYDTATYNGGIYANTGQDGILNILRVVLADYLLDGDWVDSIQTSIADIDLTNGDVVPKEAWLYVHFKDQLTAGEIAAIEANAPLMAIINSADLTSLKTDVSKIKTGSSLGSISTAKWLRLGWLSTGEGLLQIFSALSQVTYSPIYVEQSIDIISVSIQKTNVTNSTLVIAIYSELNGKPYEKISPDISIIGSTTTGLKETLVSLNLEKGTYFIGALATIGQMGCLGRRGLVSVFDLRMNDSFQIGSSYGQTSASLPSIADPDSILVADYAPCVAFREV